MRLLIIHQFDPSTPAVGGIDGFIRDFVSFISPKHSVALVGVDAGNSRALGEWTDATVGDRLVRFMPVARLDPGNQRRRLPHTGRLLAGLVRNRPDAKGLTIHSHRAEIGGALALLYPRQRRVQFIHGDGRESHGHRQETFWRYSPAAYERVERFAVGRAAKTFVFHSGAAERLGRRSSAVVAADNWYDGAIFWPPSDRAPEFRIGWAGRLEPPKDPMLAVAVFDELRQQGITYSAWMAGVGSLHHMVARELGRRCLEDRVRLVGHLSAGSLASELRETSVLLMTSRWEGIPRAAIEALACGVPVVTPAVGDVERVVKRGKGGFLSESRSASNLTELVTQARWLDSPSAIAGTVKHLEVRASLNTLVHALEAAE